MHESEKWKGSRSVVSDSSRPHGLQPTRLLGPWDFPGKSTGVGCHWVLLFLSFIVPTFAWNVPLVSLIFLKRYLVFLCIVDLRRLYYLSLLFFETRVYVFNWVYLSLSPSPFTSLLLSAISRASSDNCIPVLHFFFFRMVLVTASCTMLQTSVHSSSSTLSVKSNPLNLFVTSTV